MKKLLIFFLMLGLFLFLTSGKNLMWCKKLIDSQANSENIQTKEYFSNLSQHYYGSPNYWHELSIVNKAVQNLNSDELIIPSLDAINRLKNEQSVSLVYELQQKN